LLWLAPLTAIVIVAANEMLAWTVPLLDSIDLIAPPDVIPEIFGNAYETLGNGDTTFMGEAVTPATVWLVPFCLIFWMLLAVVGEEMVWRGYVLSAHEIQYGWRAWVINGILWNVPFHLYTLHNLLSDMPLYFLLPALVFWRKDTWYGIARHSLLVSIALVILVPGLLQAG
jgi:membrane protease YdiL (CAAX protease family)